MTEYSKFDYKDIKIIDIIDRNDSQISTKKISQILKKKEGIEIAPRSVRYRLKKMIEKGLLHRKIAITHERKLGIGEYFFLVEENPTMRKKFIQVLNQNRALDWYLPTYGKYNGYCIHALYFLENPDYPLNIFKELKKREIIKDFFAFDVLDYRTFGWDFNYFNSEGEWIWTWKTWEEHLSQELLTNKIKPITFQKNPKIVEFDAKDIEILQQLYLNEKITLKEISKALNLSETQISRRIKSMEKEGIIRGYRTGFNPFNETTTVIFMIKSKLNMEQIYYHIFKIPYPINVAINLEETNFFLINIPSKEITNFFNAFNLLIPIIDSYFFQIWTTNPPEDYISGYNFYNPSDNSWKKLNKYHKQSLRQLR